MSDEENDRTVCALPPGCVGSTGRGLPSGFGFDNANLLQQALDSTGLLYRHPELGLAVSSLLHVEPAETTLGDVLHQSLMRLNELTHRPQVFQWNPRAQVVVEPISLQLASSDGAEAL